MTTEDLARQHAERFFDELIANEAFREKIEAVGNDPKAILNLATQAGFSLNPEALQTVLQERSGTDASGSLPDEALATVSGGSALVAAFRICKALTVFTIEHASEIYGTSMAVPEGIGSIKRAIDK